VLLLLLRRRWCCFCGIVVVFVIVGVVFICCAIVVFVDDCRDSDKNALMAPGSLLAGELYLSPQSLSLRPLVACPVWWQSFVFRLSVSLLEVLLFLFFKLL